MDLLWIINIEFIVKKLAKQIAIVLLAFCYHSLFTTLPWRLSHRIE